MKFISFIAIALVLMPGMLASELLAQDQPKGVRPVAQVQSASGPEATLNAAGFKQFSRWLGYTSGARARMTPDTMWEMVVDHTNPDNAWDQTFPGIRNHDPCYVWYNDKGMWVGDQKAYDKLIKLDRRLDSHHHQMILVTISTASGAACTFSHYSTYVPGSNYTWLFVCP